jgi:putative ABC transport system permease protein
MRDWEQYVRAHLRLPNLVPARQSRIVKELASQLEDFFRDAVARGMTESDADAFARAQIADWASLAASLGEVDRAHTPSPLDRWTMRLQNRRQTAEGDRRRVSLIEDFVRDVRHGGRFLRRNRGFAVPSILTLALGIGANGAMFAVADATLLRPLPFPDADRLVSVSEMRGDGRRGAANPLDFVDWSERNRTFEAMAAAMTSQTSITGTDGVARSLPGQAVSARFFDVLGIKPIAGRTFQRSDEGPAPSVVVIGEGLWRSHFGGDPRAIGRPIRLGGRTFSLVGVVPASFQFDIPGIPSIGPIQVWTVLNPPRSHAPAERYPHYLPVVARMKPGVTIESARAEMVAISNALAEEWPATNHGHRATVDPLRDRVGSPDLRLTSMLLFGVVAFVLLMCCANVANLLLARTSARTRELAVRSALGAGRRRIVRQLLTESLVLAALGGLLGVATGAAILKAAPSLVPPGLLPLSVPLAFDERVLVFSVSTTFLVAILYGLAPAWQATGVPLAQTMSLDSRTAIGGSSRLRRGLAVVEVAVAVLLLCGAGLLLRTLLTLQDVDPGHRAGDLLTAGISPGADRSSDESRQYYDVIERAVRSAPGVGDVAWGSALPLAGGVWGQSFQIDGDPPRPPTDRDGTGYHIVSPSFFRVLRLSVIQGRAFTDADAANAPQVAIVDEAFVRRYLQRRTPIGTRVLVNAMATPPQVVLREIVGVVKHVKERPEESEAQPHLYVPLAQNTWWAATLIVQPAGGRAEAVAPAVRAAIARVDPDRAPQFRTLAAIETQATSRPRFRAVLVGAFALLALTLALVGVFGVLAYSVEQRRREFGVRLALGASAASVLRLVMSSAAVVIGIGIATGLIAAAVLGRSISAFLFGVRPLDPMTFVLVPVVLIATAALAVAAPAWRASRVDPVMALRQE